MMTSKNLAIASSLAIAAGCATIPYQPYAREVKKQPQAGGVIALNENHRDEDRAKAENLMRANCGTLPVKVLEEGEVATGTQTNTASKETKDKENQGGFKAGVFTFGGAPKDANNTATNAVTTELKEWRISYGCVAAVEEPPPTEGLEEDCKKMKHRNVFRPPGSDFLIQLRHPCV